MITPEELTKRLAEIKDLQDQLYAIWFNKNPLVKFEKCDEVKRLENLLSRKLNELSWLCAEDKTYFFLDEESLKLAGPPPSNLKVKNKGYPLP